ncbi:MAG TPA: L,D-transpeptidase [Xanthobacteraceae bacterium]|nr:L,D-transpeptidase [Xanthobacteraceae bacterium]
MGLTMRFPVLAFSALVAGLALSCAAPASAYESPFSFFRPSSFGMGPKTGLGYSNSSISRQTVAFDGKYQPGSIVIRTGERRLYYVLGDGRALRYGVGVGRPGFEWTGVKTVTAKKEWPGWTPPPPMLKRRPDLPRYMEGGIDNPLGARAMYLGSSWYRIHGSNEPETIGQAVSSGCFRMTNDDVTDLYERVKVGTRVYVMR